MKKVAVEDVLRIQEERAAINRLNFDEIVWVFKGRPVDIPKEIIDRWDFTGLNNVDFVTSNFWYGRPW